MKVSLVGPFPPPAGGMSLQSELLSRKLTDEGICVLKIPTNPKLGGVFRIFTGIRGARTFIRFFMFLGSLLRHLPECDVIHLLSASHVSFFIDSCPVIFLSRIFRQRLIINYHGGEAENFFNKWKKIVIPFLRWADVIMVPSKFLEEVFKKFGIQTDIVPNIVDLDDFVCRPQNKLKPRLINTRHLEPVYNLECTLRAFNIVKKKIPGSRLVLAGTGSEEKRLRAIVDEMGLKGVSFLGEVRHSELPDIYGQGGVFINSSRADNMPSSILEAFASGLPVVSTNVGGIPYLVRHEYNGLLVGPDDHEGLAREVSRLFEDHDLARKLAENARKDCEEKYVWAAIKDRLLRIYSERE